MTDGSAHNLVPGCWKEDSLNYLWITDLKIKAQWCLGPREMKARVCRTEEDSLKNPKNPADLVECGISFFFVFGNTRIPRICMAYWVMGGTFPWWPPWRPCCHHQSFFVFVLDILLFDFIRATKKKKVKSAFQIIEFEMTVLDARALPHSHVGGRNRLGPDYGRG